MDLTALPLYDHHCHPLLEADPVDSPESFRRCFSESQDGAMDSHLASGIFYQRAIRDLADLYGCDASEPAVLQARRAEDPEQRARRLFRAAGIGAALFDTGFPRGGSCSIAALKNLLPCPVGEILRLETLAEDLLAVTSSFDSFEERYRVALDTARDRGVTAFKTIAAYRGGLEIRSRARAEAAEGYSEARQPASGRLRLTDRRLLEYLLYAAWEEAARQKMPLQIHTGFGDDDSDLRTANPLHLRPMLRDERLRGAPVVLLHCYPYIREAGCLAGLYGNVFLDLSLTLPLVGHGGSAAILAALEQAPISKLLLATDASRIPEFFYLGARYARESLARALDRLRNDGWLTKRQAEDAAERVLWGNAAELYGA